jgi:hypothetical protein
MEEIVAEHTGQPLEKVSADMDRDYFMTAEEANEYGLIDKVLARREGGGSRACRGRSGSRSGRGGGSCRGPQVIPRRPLGRLPAGAR